MLMFREKIPQGWVQMISSNIPAVLLDHCHLERKAATSAINLIKYRELFHHVEELNAIALEELQHFQLVLNEMKQRNIPYTQSHASSYISGLMRAVRHGSREQAIDHLIAFSLIEGRSCEKFQILGRELTPVDPSLARFYASLVESEGNHYATFLLMAREIDKAEADRRLDFYLDLEGQLIQKPSRVPLLH